MRRAWVKFLCAVLLILSLSAGMVGTIISVCWYYDAPENFYDSSLCWNVTNDRQNDLWHLLDAYENGDDGYTESFIGEIRERMAPENTNFRFICRTEEGEVILGYPDMEESVSQNFKLTDWTLDVYDAETGLYVETMYEVYFGVLDPLMVHDEYMEAWLIFYWMDANVNVLLVVSIGLLLLSLVLLILLIRFAGWRRGSERPVLNWQDRIPFDLYLVVSGVLLVLCFFLFVEGVNYLSWNEDLFGLFWGCGAALLLEILALALLLTAVTRIKTRTIFRNTVICRLGSWLRRKWKAVAAAIPLIWKAAIVTGGYVLVSIVLLAPRGYWFDRSGFFFAIWLLLTLILAAYLLWWAYQWKRLRMGTREIIGGNPEHHIDNKLMPPDLKSHAAELNNLGQTISAAVEERLKSERFRAELITNVSHDLKTPLTSIINYVDLLKKEDIPNPTAQEYIEVLDRKSQRLKKLTEDLVEASKASTGALTVERELLDAAQLIRQAVGEYEEKLTGAGLTAVVTLPEEPLRIRADGRHVWRVLDNLLGNCVKYALTGTRVYVDAAARGQRVVITVKNISRQSLNVPAEQLMERFVRGDESRTTAGSGLGLSIARSLTELQDGTFLLEIDGDLFKAIVEFPLAEEN